ncbi:uncharacterized protein [Asterias amurensis]|uniref:uncharacterized protein n=1 Tax=Asterias amurensis TaxID=7602 RepID=UPI003AB80B08
MMLCLSRGSITTRNVPLLDLRVTVHRLLVVDTCCMKYTTVNCTAHVWKICPCKVSQRFTLQMGLPESPTCWERPWSCCVPVGPVSAVCCTCGNQSRTVRQLKRVCTSTIICVVSRAIPNKHRHRMAANCCRKLPEYVGFSGETIHRFTNPQAKWPLQSILWCIYRLFLAIYMTVWLIIILVAWGEPPYYSQADSKAKWLIYVSNWSFLVLIMYLITFAIGNIYYHFKNGCRSTSDGVDPEMGEENPEGIPMGTKPSGGHPAEYPSVSPPSPVPWYFKFAWFLQSMAFTSGLFVALNFYILVFNPATDTLSAYNFHVHGVNLIIIVIDILLVATPMRVLHAIYPMTMAFIFFIFTLIYQKAGGLNEFGGTAIYQNYLDWGAAPTTSAVVMMLTVFVAGPILHLIWYALYRIRLAVSKRCGCCRVF